MDPKLLTVDVAPLAPKLRNNRTAHPYYLKYTQEEIVTLREIVEHERSLNPLNTSLDYVCKYTKQIQELLIILRQTCPCINDLVAKLMAVTPMNKIKRVRSTEPVTSSVNKNVKTVSSSNVVSNKLMLSSTGVNLSTSASGSQPSGNTKKDKIQQTPSSSKENKIEAQPRNVRYSLSNKNCVVKTKNTVVQIVLWYLDSGCSKHMTGDRSQLTNFVNKILGTVKFGNDHVTKIMGYGDYHIRNVTISRVYFVERRGHNLFSVGQLCDFDLEVAFRQHTCFIRNLEGVDLLFGSRGNNMYTLSLGDMMKSSPICLLSEASKTKSWLWHQRPSHLNFGAINYLARQGLVRGLPKLKFKKDHLCSICAMGKSKKKSHKPKSEDTNQEKLYLLHMDLCGPMSKDEASDSIIKFLKMIQVRLKVPVRCIRTDNGTEFVNQTMREYYEQVSISHETSVARSPQQNGIIERRNRTLIKAARTMLIYERAPLFLWALAVATTCFTQNRSNVRLRQGKTPYELLHDKLPDLSYFHVFGALCYPTNDSENLGISGPALHEMTPATISSGLVPNPTSSTPFVPPSRTDWDLLFQQLFDELFNPPPSVDHPATEVIAPIAKVVVPEPAESTGSPSSTTVDQDAPSPNKNTLLITKFKLEKADKKAQKLETD
nr:hypothetical protein [Tanacetum cinerariifolium]